MDNRFRPHYHISVNGNGMPGDTNGPFWANGRYHLMCLVRRENPETYYWAHLSSENLLQWQVEPDAVGPGEKDPTGAFSGGAFVDDDGTAYITYWMLNNWGPGSGIGITAANAASGYTRWEKFPENPVVDSTDFGFTRMRDADGRELYVAVSDPSNIWKQNGKYYFITGNLPLLEKMGRNADSPECFKGDHADLFESSDLRHWRYAGPFYQRNVNETRATGWTDADEDCMCPVFLPLPCSPDGGAPGDKHLLLYISHNRGCQYYIGTLADKRFIPEKHGRMTWLDNAFFAPDALIDPQGRMIAFIWLLDVQEKEFEKFGWSGVYAMPRTLWLKNDGTLGIAPVQEMKQLRRESKVWRDIVLKPGEKLNVDGIESDCCELEFELDEASAKAFELHLHVSEEPDEKVVIRYDDPLEELVFDTGRGGYGKIAVVKNPSRIERAPFKLGRGEMLSLRVFVDGPVIEVFANDRQAISRRFYPAGNGKGISLNAVEGPVTCRMLSGWTLNGFHGIADGL